MERPSILRMRRIYLYPIAAADGHYVFTDHTWADLAAEGIVPEEGMAMSFYCDDGEDEGERDDLLFEGTIHRDALHWYALVDRNSLHHASQEI